MSKSDVEVSIDSTIRSTIQAMERVTSAILAGRPAGAGTISGKKVTAQYTFRMRDPSIKKSIEEAGHRKLVAEVFSRNAVKLESAIRTALNDIIANMVGLQGKNIQVLGRSLGKLTARVDLGQESFAKFIKSKQGAGEVGLPDPEESLDQLRLALLAAITVDVTVRRNGPQVKFRFDQRKLIKLTPHPDQFEAGPKGAFYSWLSLLTGPEYLSGGTPGYALVRVGDIRKELRKVSVKQSGLTSIGSRRGMKKIEFLYGAINVSRTKGYAGEMAGIMLKTTRSGKSKKTQSEYFGGKNKDYQPSKNFSGFWDRWWVQRKEELSIFVRRIMMASIRALLRG